MKYTIVLSSLLCLPMVANAELQPMDNQQMQVIQGQGAATIDWQLSLNQTSPGVLDAACTDAPEYCRLAISTNNRYDDGSYIKRDGTAYKADGTPIAMANFTGKKQWVVFKGVQGTIHLQDVELDGTDLKYRNKDNSDDVIKAALQFTFNAAKPIEIRNFGFSALAIETDTHVESNSSNTPGYLATSVYTAADSAFDAGRETGFTGLNMHGNLALQGTLKMFSCDGSHPRC